jgi:hypothetical protein
MAAAMTDQLEIKLKPDVKIARRGDEVVLVGEASRALRLAGTSCQLIDLLAAGCSRKALGMHLQTLGFPAGQIEPAIAEFLSRLASAGVLQSKHDSANAAQGRRMINVDPLARFFARPILLLPGWLAVSLGALALLAAVASITVASFKGRLLSFPPDFSRLSPMGFFGIIPWVLLHEFSHAVACRSIGCQVSGLGLRFRKWSGLSFFVDTRYVTLSPNRWAKAWVALAGPFMDIILLGVVSVMALLSPAGRLDDSCRLLFLMMTGALFFNLNPWRASDGSNAAVALSGNTRLLADALSFRTGQKSLGCLGYRIAALVYLLLFAAGVGYFMCVSAPSAGKWFR